MCTLLFFSMVNFCTTILFQDETSELIAAVQNGHKNIVTTLLLAKVDPNHLATKVRRPAEKVTCFIESELYRIISTKVATSNIQCVLVIYSLLLHYIA